MEELNKILDLELAMPQSADEASYCRAWRLQVQPCWPCSPIMLALLGGRLAHDFATVFTAGYQAAIRAVFPQARFEGVSALAVSEDRSKERPMPGVSWRTLDGQFELDGTKTWVAASEEVEQLVVKAKVKSEGEEGDRESGYFLLQLPQPGIVVSTYAQSSVLPKLSQGKAYIDTLKVPSETRLDSTLMTHFGRAESLCIYTAFVAMIWQKSVVSDAPTQDVSITTQCVSLLEQAVAIDVVEVDAKSVACFDDDVQGLLRQLSQTQYAADKIWQRDHRLISMYSAGLQKQIR